MSEILLGPEHKPTRIINYEETAQSRLFCIDDFVKIERVEQADWQEFMAVQRMYVEDAVRIITKQKGGEIDIDQDIDRLRDEMKFDPRHLIRTTDNVSENIAKEYPGQVLEIWNSDRGYYLTVQGDSRLHFKRPDHEKSVIFGAVNQNEVVKGYAPAGNEDRLDLIQRIIKSS